MEPKTFSLPFDIPTTILNGITYALIDQPGTIQSGASLTFSETWNGTFTALSNNSEVKGGFIKGNGSVYIKRKSLKEIHDAGTTPPVQSYQDLILSHGVVNYWRFSETSGQVLDHKGTVHGTVNGTVYRGEPGVLSDDFALRTDYATGAGWVDLPSYTLPITHSIEFWSKSPVTGGTVTLWTNRSLAISTNVYFGFNIGKISYGANAVGPALESPLRYDDSQWHHIVVTSSAAGSKIYVDGVLVASNAVSMIQTVGTAMIGKDDFVGVATATIDELAIYHKELTPTEILSHFNARPIPTQTYQDLILSHGPAAYWPLDDLTSPAQDKVGTRHGTLSGGVIPNQPGIGTSKCMIFQEDGAGKILPATFPSLSPSFTIEAWVNSVSLYANRMGIITREATSEGDFIFEYRPSSFNLRFQYISGSWPIISQVVTFPIDTWMHIVAVGENNQVKLYVNGVTSVAPVAMDIVGPGTGTPCIGGYFSSPNEGWIGSMQDIAVYQKVLTPAEILSHFNARQ